MPLFVFIVEVCDLLVIELFLFFEETKIYFNSVCCPDDCEQCRRGQLSAWLATMETES